VATALALAAGITFSGSALSQKPGGILRIYHRDTPASMSILEEATISAEMPMMGVFNNLVEFDQHTPQNSVTDIVPDLATSWSWNADATELTFRLRETVKWHDGVPLTSKDVKCTLDLLTEKSTDRLRINPRMTWYQNIADVTTNGDYEVVFHLNRPQPSLLVLLSSGYSPIYPCHVPPAQMRTHPIGTGPFKFAEFKPNQLIRVVRNPDYWKPRRPYLDGIEYTIIPNRSTAILSFVAGKVDVTFPYELTPALMRDVKQQAPQAIWDLASTNNSVNLLINRDKPPFDNPDLRRAVALTIDRKSFIAILAEGQGDIGGAMLPPPAGLWGMPPEVLSSVAGYDPDVAKSREAAREMMKRLGYGPDKRLPIKRNIANYRDPAVILIDQMKEIWIDGELETVETANWFPKVTRKDYQIGVNVTGSGVDDPDQQFFENYGCRSARNYTGYCNPELEKLFDQQSALVDQSERKKLVWEIDKKLQEDVARPIVYHTRLATCMQPAVKGVTIMVNSQFNGWRLEDAWLDH
jgi:peptide/nickel transport system substrate-binding protein